MTPTWERDGVQLYLGDCLDILPTLPDNSVDLIATDPPYYKVKDEPWDRQWDTPTGFLAWLDRVLVEFYRLLKPNGSLYLFASPRMAARVEVLIAERFEVLNTITWAKPGQPYAEKYGPERFRGFVEMSERIIFAEHYGADGIAKGESGWGAKCDELRGFVFEPLRAYLAGEWERAGLTRQDADTATDSFMSGHYLSRSQWALPTREMYERLRTYANSHNHGGEYLRRDYEDLRRDYKDLRRPFTVSADVPYTDVWTFPTVPANNGKHPCEKPLAMMEHIIRASSRPGAVVIDPFMGSGTTGVACVQTGRKFVGIEIDEGYFEIARKRIEQAQMQLRLPMG